MLLKECIPLVPVISVHIHKEHKGIFDPISKSVLFGGLSAARAQSSTLQNSSAPSSLFHVWAE